jgi:surface protein
MFRMFDGASAFNQNIGAWNVSKVTSFVSMFSNATAFNNGGSDDIDNWTFSTTSNISMQQMFGGTSTTLSCKFNRYIGSWNTQRVTNMSFMFFLNTAFNQNIGAWNTNSLTDIRGTFARASAFNQDLSTKVVNEGLPNEYIAWNVSNVTQIGVYQNATFSFASSFNGNIDNWNISNVANIQSMFESTAFNRDISTKIVTVGGLTYTAWDVSNVTDMSSLFSSTPFNQDISNWDTSSVTNMGSMFNNNSSFNQPIGVWDTGSNQSISFMFRLASSFNQDISDWNVSNVTSAVAFMGQKFYSAANLDSIYNGWSSRPVKPNLSIDFGNNKYTAAGQAGKDILLGAPNLWTILDGGI